MYAMETLFENKMPFEIKNPMTIYENCFGNQKALKEKNQL
jgi:hypothetical protein